jgi:hypothetical protein
MCTPPPLSGMLVRLLLLPLCGAVLVVSGCSANAGTAADGRLVFCLSPAQRANLVAAAVTLGLVTQGANADRVVVDHRQLSLSDWQVKDNADFTRACDALVSSTPAVPAATSGGEGDMFLATLNALIPLLVGALLGLATSAYRDAVIRRRLQADELESITAQFVSTAGRFTRAWPAPGGIQPDGSALLDVRWKLVTSLRRASVLRPRCAPDVKETRGRVDGPVLGESLLDGWVGLSTSQQLDRVREVEHESALLTAETGRIADTLRRASWSRRVPPVPDPVLSSGTGTAS